jgi:cytoskeleton protein RodZ
MRARIDITEVELATKIRAKYLRAIENEEWQLLPGSTFAKSFIRTYADYLGVDSRSLVEEYKLRYERPSETELRTVSPGLARDRRGNRTNPRGLGGGGGGGGAPRWAITVGLLAILVAALYFIGTRGRDDKGSGTTPTTQTQPVARRGSRRTAGSTGGQTERRAVAPALAGLRLTPTGDVNVCVVDQDGRVLIPGLTYTAGQAVPLVRGRTLRVTLGNGNVTMRANGRAVEIPQSSTAFGFQITPRGATAISGDQLPTCT